jgi:hypothetical protein
MYNQMYLYMAQMYVGNLKNHIQVHMHSRYVTSLTHVQIVTPATHVNVCLSTVQASWVLLAQSVPHSSHA